MFGRKRKTWYRSAFTAMVFMGFLYRCARFFMKAAEKQAGMNVKKKKEKKSTRCRP
jgi:hypothetical protein